MFPSAEIEPIGFVFFECTERLFVELCLSGRKLGRRLSLHFRQSNVLFPVTVKPFFLANCSAARFRNCPKRCRIAVSSFPSSNFLAVLIRTVWRMVLPLGVRKCANNLAFDSSNKFFNAFCIFLHERQRSTCGRYFVGVKCVIARMHVHGR